MPDASRLGRDGPAQHDRRTGGGGRLRERADPTCRLCTRPSTSTLSTRCSPRPHRRSDRTGSVSTRLWTGTGSRCSGTDLSSSDRTGRTGTVDPAALTNPRSRSRSQCGTPNRSERRRAGQSGGERSGREQSRVAQSRAAQDGSIQRKVNEWERQRRAPPCAPPRPGRSRPSSPSTGLLRTVRRTVLSVDRSVRVSASSISASRRSLRTTPASRRSSAFRVRRRARGSRLRPGRTGLRASNPGG